MVRPGSSIVAALVSALASGCIVAEPAPYEPPPRTPPILDLVNTLPWVGAPIPVDHFLDPNPDEITTLEFDIPIRSEDHDEELCWALHLDYRPGVLGRKTDVVHDRIPGSTFDDETRRLVFSWNVDAPQGCHQLTLLVAHESNWIVSAEAPDLERAAGDVAVATWWINVNPPPGERFVLRNCPVAGVPIEP